MDRIQKSAEPSLRLSQPAYPPMPQVGILVFESHHSSNFTMEPRQFEFYKLCWIPVGRGWIEFGHSRLPIERDGLLFIPAGTEHRFVDNPTAPLTLVFAHFSKQLVQESKAMHLLMPELNHRFNSPSPLIRLNSYRRGAVRDTFKKMLVEQSRGGNAATALLYAGLIDLLVCLLRSKSAKGTTSLSREQLLDGTLDYIEEYFHTPIRVKDLAAMCNLSSRRYSDLFKQRTGMTIVKYIWELRMNYAKEKLRETGQIKYAAIAAGYNDVTHFYRVFKRMTGMTPGEYIDVTIGEKN
jgi:AraC family L-rhamnose operon transcriptional activator RhaR